MLSFLVLILYPSFSVLLFTFTSANVKPFSHFVFFDMLQIQCDVHLIALDAGSVNSSYVGEAESKLRDAFDRAAALAQTQAVAVFIDQLDLLCPHRYALCWCYLLSCFFLLLLIMCNVWCARWERALM